MVKVIKRNGQKVDFDKEKIYNAVRSANEEILKQSPRKALNKTEFECVLNEILNRCNRVNTDLTVEEIQDLVEETLVNYQNYEVAKCYILYRYKRAITRDKYKELMDEVAEKLSAENVQNQNANVDEKSFGGRIGEMTNSIMKRYALEYCMSEMARNNHLNNEIYIHDLSHYAVGNHNCLSIPFDKLLANGFKTRQTDVRSAQSVSTAFQLVAVIFQLQSLQQFGGVSATHLDWTMIPYVRKSFRKHIKDGLKYIERLSDYKIERFFKYFKEEDIVFNCHDEILKNHKEAYDYALDMTEKEIYQAVEGMYHNLNTLQSRSGNQLPFTSINYGTCTEPEGRMVTKALLEVSIGGIGKLHKTSVFPCGIFQVMSDVNKEKGTPNYDLFRLALRSTAQRLYPNYANVDWSGNDGYDKNNPQTFFSTMGKQSGYSSSKTF